MSGQNTLLAAAALAGAALLLAPEEGQAQVICLAPDQRSTIYRGFDADDYPHIRDRTLPLLSSWMSNLRRYNVLETVEPVLEQVGLEFSGVCIGPADMPLEQTLQVQYSQFDSDVYLFVPVQADMWEDFLGESHEYQEMTRAWTRESVPALWTGPYYVRQRELQMRTSADPASLNFISAYGVYAQALADTEGVLLETALYQDLGCGDVERNVSAHSPEALEPAPVSADCAALGHGFNGLLETVPDLHSAFTALYIAHGINSRAREREGGAPGAVDNGLAAYFRDNAVPVFLADAREAVEEDTPLHLTEDQEAELKTMFPGFALPSILVTGSSEEDREIEGQGSPVP